MVMETFGWGGIAHGGAHIGFFSGVGMLLPILSQAWENSVKPWLLSPVGFFIGLALIIVSVAIIAYAAGSFSKVLKSVGWLIMIPGVIAILFSVFGEFKVWTWTQTHVTGFTIIEPGVRWLVHHSVPSAAFLGGIYIIVGVFFLWAGRKVYRMSDYM